MPWCGVERSEDNLGGQIVLFSIFQASWPMGFQAILLSQPHIVPQMCWGYRCSPLSFTGFLVFYPLSHLLGPFFFFNS